MVKQAVGFKGLNFLSTKLPGMASRYADSVMRTPGSLPGSLATWGRALVEDGRVLPWRGSAPAELRRKLIASAESMASMPAVGGFAAPGRNTVAINRSFPQSAVLGVPRREAIAHEAFHARNPVLGQSETAARFYGGYRGVPARGFEGAQGPVWAQRISNGLDRVQQYLPQRPLYGWMRRQQYADAPVLPAPSATAGANGWLAKGLNPAQRFFSAYGDDGNFGSALQFALRPPAPRKFTADMFAKIRQ